MSEKNGPWTIEETEKKYHNSFIDVQEDQVVQPDGKPGSYATVKMKAGVAVLPMDDEGNVYLVKQFRYALKRESVEVVCGAIDGDEPPLEAAKREVKEELGIEAAEWTDLGMFDMDTSIVNCPVFLFTATNLKFTSTEREGTETMKTVKMSLEEAVENVMESSITHGPSSILILKGNTAMNLRGENHSF
ncbi:NUDIX hydrolase [Ancylothrix sp. C2]|uniref:NUDIX domain-containing protein n=1 Tax=Ancylothrix sp. D3o TaxID=2953691 RepID=UPI0021BAA601|nr:NUDIX hydrolase [Ancylothrix sp. D3o]MCT7952017.1 NUDIX hydrolase [Ancylothrix sp. D3o]